jgi:hypothetical protein
MIRIKVVGGQRHTIDHAVSKIVGEKAVTERREAISV